MSDLPDLATCKKIGFIVPSSNTAVEPITTAIFQAVKHANIMPIFTRIRVTTVGTDSNSTSQFSTETMVAAAQLLADAEADAILWNGTSGMWVGTLEADRHLAKAMEDATGVPCSTTTLATVAALEKLKIKRLGIAVPYTEALANKVRVFLTNTGHDWKITSVARMDPAPGSNLAIAKSGMLDIRSLVTKAGLHDAEAIVVACTNWPAAGVVEEVEEKLGVIVIDSIIVTVWLGLRMIGNDDPVAGFGRLMSLVV